MTEINQKKLYDNFKRLSKEGKDSKQRTECARYAKQILDSFPHFEKPVKEEKPAKETKPVKEK